MIVKLNTKLNTPNSQFYYIIPLFFCAQFYNVNMGVYTVQKPVKMIILIFMVEKLKCYWKQTVLWHSDLKKIQVLVKMFFAAQMHLLLLKYTKLLSYVHNKIKNAECLESFVTLFLLRKGNASC